MKLETKFKYGLADITIPSEKQALTDAFCALGGEPTDGPNWDILWYNTHEPPVELYKNISALRRINHIPGIYALTDKWELYKNLSHHWQKSGLDKKADSSHRYFPKSWKLPENKEEIKQQLQNQPEKPLILKRLYAVNGVAMKLIKHGDELPVDDEWIVQEYIENPHLINDRKYILQVFLLITSSDPLTVYIYQNGVADLAVQAYSSEPEQWNNAGMHIATTILQIRQPGFDLAEHCLTFKQWQTHIEKTDHKNHVWPDIETILKNTLNAVIEPKSENAALLNHPEQCFELLAVDIMLDSTLKPWLIECNRSASMIPQYTGMLKPALLKDTLGLILKRRQTLSGVPVGQAAPESVPEFGDFKRII